MPVERPWYEQEHPLVRERRVTAAALIACAVVLGVVLVLTLGPDILAVYLPTLPFAFILMWASTTALRFDEREETKREETARPEVEVAPTPADASAR